VSHEKAGIRFDDLNLSKPLLDVLHHAKYHHPTPIQAQLIPHGLAGRDVIGQAQTGTGKTAAFLLPYLSHWSEKGTPGPTALVLVPTRELAVQVADEAKKLTPNRHLRILAVYGGTRIVGQLKAFQKGIDLVVGTPGRVLDHLARGSLILNGVKYVVLDEADRMLDIGFRPDIEKILRRAPTHRQTMLLSATVSHDVLRLTHRYMKDPIHINVSPETPTVDKIRQTFYTVDEDRKFDLLLRVLVKERPRQCIIFCRRKRDADRLHHRLAPKLPRCAAMHGDLQQSQRDRIMQGFRAGEIIILVATDVVGRGIDVLGISHIINYDLPEDIENYVHRIGRTGRIGNDGVAISFVTPEQGELLTAIEIQVNRLLEEERMAHFTAYTPKPREEKPAAPRAAGGVFGRRTKKYSRRL
jgi:ATP-dependent RNA helicase DeaD